LESIKELIKFDHEYYKKPVEESVQTIAVKENITETINNTVPCTEEQKTVIPDLMITMDGDSLSMDIPDVLQAAGSFDCDLKELLSVDTIPQDSYSDSGISDAESSDFPASPLSESGWHETFTDLFPSLSPV